MPDLTHDQAAALAMIKSFVCGAQRCFILKGYAGTGKTFLIGQIADWLDEQKVSFSLLAPTGRAARVIGEKTRRSGSTIHRHIYNLNDLIEHDDLHARFRFYFQLKASAVDDTNHILIVDESSMISDVESEGEFIRFGSGRVLFDLMDYARIKDPTQRFKILFVGDTAQLPPVSMNRSPALDASYLEDTYGLKPDHCELTQVVRQANESKILKAATLIRDNIRHRRFNQLWLDASPPEIVGTTSDQVADIFKRTYKPALPFKFVCITYANDTALRYNLLIRSKLWGGTGEQPVKRGDALMIIANNRSTGLMNGDLALVLDAAQATESRTILIRRNDPSSGVELVWRVVTLGINTVSNGYAQIRCRILENVLYSNRRDITPDEQKALYIDFKIRNSTLRPNTKAFTEAINSDEYFNALRVKFGYSATCHKAQGGEWDEAIVVFEHVGTDLHAQRWAYTAITRAKKALFAVNLPSRKPWDGLLTNPDSLDFCRPEEDPETLQPEARLTLPAVPEHLELPTDAPEPVRRRHALLLNAWSAQDVKTDAVQPNIQGYQIRYQLTRNAQKAMIALSFNGRGNVTGVHPLSGPGHDVSLADMAVSIFEDSHEISFPDHKPFLKQFYDEAISPIAVRHNARVSKVEHLEYAERYTFRNASGAYAVVTYYYDGRGRFTKRLMSDSTTNNMEFANLFM